MKSSLFYGLSVQTEGETGIFLTYKGRQYTYSLIKISYSIQILITFSSVPCISWEMIEKYNMYI